MLLGFLIPFTIALMAAAVGYCSGEEIVKIFATILMILNLLLSFAWAPWFLQIMILGLSLGGLRYFCDRHLCHPTEAFRTRSGLMKGEK